ncbi:hypothetical protein [Streptomyces sp. 2P-4]|uniref:hypothetical protein n=1 Tax=Streptomyces sp. 2P-4 TaxID=2931974 RepID=UPI00253FEEEC|nr:hypothetical protein [Streptomyces sp. 2P-4]
MPIDWAEHLNRSAPTVEELVGPFLLNGVSSYEQGVMYAAAFQRYLAYLGTLNETDAVQSIKALLLELSTTAAWLAREASPKRPAATFASVRSGLISGRNLTPLEAAQLMEKYKLKGF